MSWAALWIPVMQPFREDARFRPLVRRLRLTDYWKVHGPPDNCAFVDERVLSKMRAP